MFKFSKMIISLIIILLLCSYTNNKILRCRSYGIDYLENSDYEGALSYFDEALKLGNGDVGKIQFDLLLYKAECLFMLKRYNEAKNIYETLLSIDENNSLYKELYDNVSSVTYLSDFKIALDNNDVENAEIILSKLKELGKEHEKSVMYNQAVLYERKGEWKNALNAFNYYLKLYPGDENALHEVEFINAQLNYAN